MQSYSTVTSNHDIMPWGVMKNSFTPGQPYEHLHGQQLVEQRSAVAALRQQRELPGSQRRQPVSRRDQRRPERLPDQLQEMIDVKPGQNAGPTRQGIDTRITNWKPLNQIVDYSDPAHATVLDSSSRQLVLIPIVEDPGRRHQLVERLRSGARDRLRLVRDHRAAGLHRANGKTVTGTFVGLEDPATVGDQTGRLEPEREPESREHDRSDAVDVRLGERAGVTTGSDPVVTRRSVG